MDTKPAIESPTIIAGVVAILATIFPHLGISNDELTGIITGIITVVSAIIVIYRRWRTPTAPPTVIKGILPPAAPSV